VYIYVYIICILIGAYGVINGIPKALHRYD